MASIKSQRYKIDKADTKFIPVKTASEKIFYKLCNHFRLFIIL